jgi:nicotinamidase/pyrazinamidase
MDPARDALLVVDVQNDFCAGGALAVPHADRVVAALNRYIGEAVAKGVTIYASRDWHPAVTRHFKAFGGEWPVHCVKGTPGAAFHKDLRLPRDTIVISKDVGPDSHGYSAFEGTTPDGSSFGEDLARRGIEHLYVGGLATDYCVQHSVLAALDEGFDVTVLEDAIAGVNLDPEDSARALDRMRQRGAIVLRK